VGDVQISKDHQLLAYTLGPYAGADLQSLIVRDLTSGTPRWAVGAICCAASSEFSGQYSVVPQMWYATLPLKCFQGSARMGASCSMRFEDATWLAGIGLGAAP
jgi:hypothetical protein